MNSSERIVNVLMSMLRGEKIDFEDYRTVYGKSGRTFHRDLEAIRNNEDFASRYVLHYNTVQKKYYVTNIGVISSAEVLAILKILIGSRALSKKEINDVIKQLLELVATEDQSNIRTLLTTTSESYLPAVDEPIFPRVKQFSEWIIAKKSITFKYNGIANSTKSTTMQAGVPLSMYYDNHHFYIMMYLIDDDKTFLYRLDQFDKIIPKGKTVHVPADKRPDIGRMINKTFLLNGGNHVHYKFSYEGNEKMALENVPNSYLSKDDDASNPNVTIVEGDLFSQGALLWILSQGAQVKVLGPQSLIEKLRKELKKTLEYYSDGE